VDVERKTGTRLTFDGAAGPGAWTPDSKRIFFSAEGKVLSIAATGGDPVIEGDGVLHHMHVLADRQQILADTVESWPRGKFKMAIPNAEGSQPRWRRGWQGDLLPSE